MNLTEKLEAIRKLLDVNTTDVDIESVVNHGKELASMIGLSAECKSEAKRNLENARLIALKMPSKGVPPSILSKMIDASCADQIAQFEYADRLNAGITHSLDFIRSVMSLHKIELENSMKQ
jgi:hypothetical protein